MRRHEFGHPARVERFHREEDEVELRLGRSQLAHVKRLDANLEVYVRHLDAEPVFFHRFHVRGPLIHDGDVIACIGEVCGGAAADGSGSEHADLIEHLLPSPGFLSADDSRMKPYVACKS